MKNISISIDIVRNIPFKGLIPVPPLLCFTGVQVRNIPFKGLIPMGDSVPFAIVPR